MLERTLNYLLGNIFEPSLNWAINHPFVSVVVVGALLFFAVRNYRML